MSKALNYTINLIRSVICGESAYDFDSVSLGEWEEILELSAKHDLGHIVGKAIGDYNIPVDEDIKNTFFSLQLSALLRYERIKISQEKLYDILEKNSICYVPLKGSVIKNLYPEPWLRTSCDIDVLVKKSEVEFVSELLVNKLRWRKQFSGTHDVSFFSDTDIHIELHFDLIEDESNAEGKILHNWKADILSKVWENLSPVEGYNYRYAINDEVAYFYHIAHMAKHFEGGGCGIRPFIDLWLLDNKLSFDKGKRDEILASAKLLTFAEACRNLAEVWLSGKEHCNITKSIAEFIVQGGVYGNMDNKVAVRQTYQDSKIKYTLSRIFLPYDALKNHYPILKKYKFLTPFYEVKRWIKLIFKNGSRRSYNELKTNILISDDKINSTKDLIKQLEL